MEEQLTIQEAARELRSRLSLSQQAMATAIGGSMAATRNHESGAAAPDSRALLRYLSLAELNSWSDLARVFHDSLLSILGFAENTVVMVLRPQNKVEHLYMTGMIAAVRGQGDFRKYQRRVINALKEPAALVVKQLGWPKGEVGKFPAGSLWIDDPEKPGTKMFYGAKSSPKSTRRSK